MEGDAGGGRGALSPAEVQRFSFQSGPVGGETLARPAQRRSFSREACRPASPTRHPVWQDR